MFKVEKDIKHSFPKIKKDLQKIQKEIVENDRMIERYENKKARTISRLQQPSILPSSFPVEQQEEKSKEQMEQEYEDLVEGIKKEIEE